MNQPKWLVLFLIWLMMLVAYMDRVNISVAGGDIMKTLHLDKAQFGLVLSAFTAGYALLQWPGGWVADRVGAKPLLVTALLAWSVFTGLTGVVASLAALLAVRLCFGIGEGLENGAQFKLISEHFTPQERSRASGFFLSALAVGPAVATPLSALLIAHFGWRSMFTFYGVLGVAVAILLLLLLPSPGQKRREV